MIRDCSVPGCHDPRFAKRLCRMHYERQRKGKPLEPPRYASRLTVKAVEEIKASKLPLSQLAAAHGISESYADMIRRGVKNPTGR